MKYFLYSLGRIARKQCSWYLHCSLEQETNCAVSCLGFHVHTQKVLDLGAFWILDFQVRDAQSGLRRAGNKGSIDLHWQALSSHLECVLPCEGPSS